MTFVHTPTGWCLSFGIEVSAHRVVLGITAAQAVVIGGFSPNGNLVSISVDDPDRDEPDGEAE